jgi:Ca2+-binding EF-hand superfamily protein
LILPVLLLAAGPALAAQKAQPAKAPPPLVVPAAQQPTTRASVTQTIDTSFRQIDTNGDGTLSAAELGVAETRMMQQRLAAVRARVEAEFTKLDTNKDGQLSKAEFMAAAPAAPPASDGAKPLAELDKNKDGKVTIDEFRTPVLARFDRIDTNHDGVVSPAENQAARTAATRR